MRGGWSHYTDTSEPVDSNGAQNMVTVQSESHYTDTSEPVDGNEAQNMVTVQSGLEPATFRSLAHELTNCSNRAHKTMLCGKIVIDTIHQFLKTGERMPAPILGGVRFTLHLLHMTLDP
jgi:hypothetical protein